MEGPNKSEEIEKVVESNIVDKFKSGELKLMNTDSIYLNNDQMKLIEEGNVKDENVQDLLKEKNILLGKSFIYRVNDEILMSTDPEDMGTCLYEQYSNVIEKIKS